MEPIPRPFLIVAALVVAILLLPYLPPARTVMFTAALVPELVGLPIRPLSNLPTPKRTTTTYGSPADRLDIYVPVGASPTRRLPSVVLALGVHPQPIDDPQVVDLATAISRVGVVVAVPDSSALRQLRVTPAEPTHLADAVEVVGGLPEVDPARIGLAGFSAGASIALIAATDARLADRLSYVSAFGGYAEAEVLLVDVATRTAVIRGAVQPWQPDAGIGRDVLELMLGALEDPDERVRVRGLLEPVVAAETPPTGPRAEDVASLSGDARAIYLLFTAADREAAATAIAAISPEVRSDLAGISPVSVADRIRAPVYILHGEPDTAIPVSHADLLAGAIGEEVRRLTRFGRFGHGQPGQDGLNLEDAGDLWELTLYLRDIVAAATE